MRLRARASGVTLNRQPISPNTARDAWIKAMAALVRGHLGNWLEIAPPDAGARKAALERARALGAGQ